MILHAIAGLARAAGTSVFCGELCNHMARQGKPVAIAVPSGSTGNDYPVDPGVRVEPFRQTMPDPDLVHIHALWSPFVHQVAAWAFARGIPVVLSPHGMLTPWALNNNAWKKQLALLLYQRSDLARATLFHATSPAEVDDIRRLGFRQPIVLAPLGVELPAATDLQSQMFSGPCDPRTVLFISRIHPKKGLPMLLEAWARLKSESPSLIAPLTGRGWRLAIAGPDENAHKKELFLQGRSLGLTMKDSAKDQALSADIVADVVFTGPVFSADKSLLYARSDLFVLPSFSENFGVVVAEALAFGLPVITTTGTPWQELEDVDRDGVADNHQRAGWWISPTVNALYQALREALTLSDEERHVLGANGRWLVERRYSWHGVAQVMGQTYDWELGRTLCPAEVYL